MRTSTAAGTVAVMSTEQRLKTPGGHRDVTVSTPPASLTVTRGRAPLQRSVRRMLVVAPGCTSTLALSASTTREVTRAVIGVVVVAVWVKTGEKATRP